AGQVVQQAEGLLGDAVLGEVEEEVIELEVELVEPLRVLGEQVAHVNVLDLLVVLPEGLPGAPLGRLDRHGASLWEVRGPPARSDARGEPERGAFYPSASPEANKHLRTKTPPPLRFGEGGGVLPASPGSQAGTAGIRGWSAVSPGVSVPPS